LFFHNGEVQMSQRPTRLSRQDLYNVAIYQKVILLCILVYLVVVIVSLVARITQVVLPLEAQLFMGIAVLASAVVATVFVFMLALKMYSTGAGIVLGLLTLIPCIGLITLLIINQKATRLLRKRGYKVGLLGARLPHREEDSGERPMDRALYENEPRSRSPRRARQDMGQYYDPTASRHIQATGAQPPDQVSEAAVHPVGRDEVPEVIPVEQSKQVGTRPRSRRGLLLGLIISGITLLGLIGAGALVGVYHRWNSGIPANAWRDFSPPNGHCHILMPGKPVQQARRVDTGLGNGQKYMVNLNKHKSSFVLCLWDFPQPALAQRIFEEAYKAERDHVVSVTRSKVVKETDITLDGCAGREFQVQDSRGTMLIERMYLIKRRASFRLYTVAVTGRGFSPSTGDAAKFFTSFKIDANARLVEPDPAVFRNLQPKGKRAPLGLSPHQPPNTTALGNS
jgi:hypothetical protein